MNAADYVAKRKKDLGIDSSIPTEKSTSAVDYVQKRKAELSMKPEMDAALNARGAAEMDESRLVNESRASASPAPTKSFRIPVLDYINDKVSNVGNLLNRAAITATDAIGLGQVKKHLDDGPSYVSDIFKGNAAPATTAAEKAADIIGNLYGFTAPTMGAYATGGKLAGNILEKLAPNAPKIVNALTRGAGAGLAYGTAKEGLDAAVGDQDKSITDRLKSIGTDTALFAAGDGALSALGSGAKALASKYAGTKLGDLLGKITGQEVRSIDTTPQETLALPQGRGEVRYNTALERSNLPYGNEPLVPYGESTVFALPPSARYEAAQQLRSEIPLALPESQRYADIQRKLNNELPYGSDPIIGQGKVADPLSLPQGNYVQPQRLKVATGNDALDYVMDQIKPEVEAAITVPTRRDQLISYIQEHLQIPKVEIHNMPMSDLHDLGQLVRQNISVYDKAVKVASTRGFNLPKLLEGQVPNAAQKIARNAQERAAGVYPESLPNIREPKGFNRYTPSNAAAPRERYNVNRPSAQELPVSQNQTSNSPEYMMQRAQQQIDMTSKLLRARELERPIIGRVSDPVERLGARPNSSNSEVTITPPQRKFPPSESKYEKEREQILNESSNAEEIIKTNEPRIRDKVVNILDDAEKAARERIAARRGRINSLPIDEWADHAIILAAQIGKGGVKLADATEFLVREFGEQIRPHAAKILNQARNIVKEAERRASKEAQEARSFNEGQTGDADSFSSKVSREVSKDKTSFAQKLERIRTQFVDDLAPLESLEKRVRGKVSSAEDSLYKSGRMFRGVPEKANQIVKERLSPIIDSIEKQGYTTKQLGDYALAVHAKDVNARDIKSGFTNKEIDSVIQKYGTPGMEAARKELVKVGDDMLQELVDTGVISENLMTSLRERYPNYIPLFRAFDDKAVNFADGLSGALANVTAPIKGLKGSERKVVDPLENMVKNIFQSTNAAERNKVAQQLSKLAKDDPESNFIRKLDDHNIAVMKDGEMVRYDVGPEVYDSLHNMDKTELDSLARKLANDENAKFIRQLSDKEEAGRKNVVSVLQNGNKVRYEVDPEVYKAMLNLDKESSNMLIKVLQKPASLLRAGATLTPEFSLRNPLRDVAQAFVTSKSGFNPIIDFPVGLMQAITKGDLYKQWVNELGSFGNIISNDRQVHKEALERVLKEPASKKFVNIVNGKSLIKMLRAISDTTESATKVGEFRAALRQGQSPQEAAYRSRDLMDFGRAGNSIREANKVVAFLNANIQGKSKIIRAFKEDPAGVIARAFTAITVPTIGAFLMQKYMANESQKLTINESPQWLKDSFWLLPVPGTDQVARIPKPFDLNVLFSNLPERAMNYIWNNDKEAMDGFAKKSLADSALPGMISGLLPFIEGMANYSFFREGSIIPRGEESRNYSDQYDVNTTSTAKLLAKGAETLTGGKGMFKNFSSPRIIDNTIQGLTAGLGNYATSAIDVLLNGMNITNNPVRPAKGPAQQPLAKAFLVNPTQSGKSTEKLYDLKDQLTRDKGSAKLNQNPFTDDAKLGFITSQTDLMGAITKNIRAIENDRSLTPQQKRERIDPLLKKRNEVAQQAMKRITPQATR